MGTSRVSRAILSPHIFLLSITEHLMYISGMWNPRELVLAPELTNPDYCGPAQWWSALHSWHIVSVGLVSAQEGAKIFAINILVSGRSLVLNILNSIDYLFYILLLCIISLIFYLPFGLRARDFGE